MKRHDPEANAAAYLAGVTSTRARRRFEAHILECEKCWSEVNLGREGRGLAESARELAPQPLRERVRSAVSLLPAPRIRWRRRLSLTALLALAMLGGAALTVQIARPEQPDLIRALLAHFEGGAQVGPDVTPSLPDRLGDLRLLGTQALEVGGVGIRAHRYRDPAGHEVVVYRGARTFPVAAGAKHMGAVWEARADGTVMFCADRPVPSLVAGDDRAEVLLAARLLGLS